MRIVWRQLRPNPRQIKHAGNGAHEMIVRHSVFEIERIEQLSLVPAAPPHHGPPHRFASASRNHRATDPSMSFATKSTHLGHWLAIPILGDYGISRSIRPVSLA